MTMAISGRPGARRPATAGRARRRRRGERTVFLQQLEPSGAEQRKRQRILPREVALGQADSREGMRALARRGGKIRCSIVSL